MRAKEGRLLDAVLIPPSLWDAAAGALRLAPALAQAYNVLIKRHGLQELAESRDPDDPPVGGLTRERTDQHFAQAFDGSVARAQLALLDPRGELTPAPDPYLISLAGNRLSFTDAPCGAGAAAFAFLSTIAELRVCKVLPRQPLDIFLLGAELSETAREYAQEMLNQLRETLQAQAIFVEAEFLRWDVTDSLRNTDLIKRMTQVAMTRPKRLLIVANFNAFLEKERKRKDAEPQLGELFRHASGTHSVAIWIEPSMNRAIAAGGLFPWLINVLKERWRRFARARTGSAEPVSTVSAQFYAPLSPATIAPVRLAVMPIDLVRSE
jgi:hypothetical protein